MYVIINGNRYDIPEVNFDAICELEEMGVNLLATDQNKPKLATMVRGLAAWIMDVDLQTASKEIEEHIANGGNIAEILSRITEAVEKSGFFSANRQKQPQDHKGKQSGKISQYPKNGKQSGKIGQHQSNRAQRRANNRNRNNGYHSQR